MSMTTASDPAPSEGLLRATLEAAEAAAALSQAAEQRMAALMDALPVLISQIGRDLRYWAARKNTAQLVEPKGGDTVHFGSTVTVVREDDAGKETRQTFRIVGEDEADPHKGSISYVAPLARAITGKSVGDVVEVNGNDVEILEIKN